MAGSRRNRKINTKRSVNRRGSGASLSDAINKGASAAKKATEPEKTQTRRAGNGQRITAVNTQRNTGRSMTGSMQAAQTSRNRQATGGNPRRQMPQEARRKQADTLERLKSLTGGNLRQIAGSHKTTFNAIRNPYEEQYMAAEKIREQRGEKRNTSPYSEGMYGQLLNRERTNKEQREENLKKASDLIDKGTEEIKRGKEGLGTAGKFAADLYGVSLGLASDALAGPASMGSMFSRSFGSSYKTAKDEGATDGQAALYGAGVGSLEAATEKLFAVAKPLQKLYGKGAGDEIMDRLLNKVVAKASSRGGKDILYHGGKVLTSAITEGLEEMVAEGLEPAIANQIYAEAVGKPHKTSAKDIAYAGLLGGAMGGVLGGGGQIVEYTQVQNVFGEDGAKNLADRAKESDESFGKNAMAEAIGEMVSAGERIATVQAKELYETVRQQEAKDLERNDIARSSAEAVMQREGLISPTVTDETGHEYLNRAAAGIFASHKAEAMESAASLQLPELRAEQITDAVAAIQTGVAGVDEVNLFTRGNPEARAVYETVTGLKLPDTNEGTRTVLYETIATNRVEAARTETADTVDRVKGLIQQDMSVNYEQSGQEAFAAAFSDVNVGNAMQVESAVIAFDDFYRAGRSDIPYEDVVAMENEAHQNISPEVRKAAWEAGRSDRLIASDTARGRQMILGETMAEKSVREAHRGQRGGVISELSRESRAELTASEQKILRMLARTFNINIHIVDDLGINGMYMDGEVYLSINADRGFSYVFGHEITHHMELYAPEEYNRLKELVRDRWERQGGLKDALDEKISHYAANGVKLTREEALDEIIADSTYEMIQDESFVDELCRTERGIAQRILDAIKAVLKKLREVLAEGEGFTPKQNANLLSELDILKEAERLWADGLMRAAENRDAVGTVSEMESVARFSLMEFGDGKRFVEVDGDTSIFDGLSEREQGALATKIIKEKFAGKVIGIDNKVFVNGRGAGEYGFPAKKLGTTEHDAKMRASTELDNIVDAGFNFRNRPDGEDGHIHKDVVGGFDYFDTIFKLGDKYFQGVINIKNVKNGKLFKDLTKIKDVTEDISSSYGENPKSTFLRTSSIDSISEDGENSNGKFSFKDSKGRKLSQEQAEYFKDSKVRDEDGSLLVMYHGTPNAEFTVFKDGTYFTQNKDYADVYQNQGASSLKYKKTANKPDTYEVYLNVEKPFDTRNSKERSIFEEEYYGQWGMGTPLMDSGLPDWLDGEDLREFIEEKGYDYDGLILDEGAVGGYGDEVVSRGIAYVIFNSSQVKNTDNTRPTKDSDIRYSIKDDYIDDAGNRYDKIVVLERNIFEGQKNRGKTLKTHVYRNFAGKQFKAYDEDGSEVTIEFAKENERVRKDKAKNSHKVIDKLAMKKGGRNQYIVSHADEIIAVSKPDERPHNDEHSHQWLDANGWDFRKAYMVATNGDVIEVVLNIANTNDGRKILYDFNNRKNIGHGDVPTKGSHINPDVNDIVAEPEVERKRKYSLPDTDDINDYINAHPTEFVDVPPVRDYEKDAARVRTQSIEELQELVRKLQSDKKLTHGKILDKSSIREEMNSLIRTLMSHSEGTTKKTDHKLVETALSNAEIIYKAIRDGDVPGAANTAWYAAEHIVENLNLVADRAFHEYKNLRDTLRTTAVIISEADKKNISDFAEFRNRNMGRLRIVNEGGIPVDTLYAELCEVYPELFDADIMSVPDQLMAMAEVRESLEPYDIMLSAEEVEQLVKETAHDLMEIAVRGKPWHSWADRKKECYDNKLKTMKARQVEAIRDVKIKERMRDAAKEPDIRYSFKGGTPITYESLVGKPDMKVVQVESDSVRQMLRKDIIVAAKKSVVKEGYKDDKGRIKIKNIDTGTDIIVGTPAIRHGLTRDYEANARIALNLGKYLKESVKINELEPRNGNSAGGYILLGYGKTSNGDEYPVYFVVQTLITGQDELIEFDALYSFNGKKISEAVGGANQGVQSLTSDTISISDLLNIVNEMYSDILPKSVSDHYGHGRKASKLGDSVKYSLNNNDIKQRIKEARKAERWIANERIEAERWRGQQRVEKEKEKLRATRISRDKRIAKERLKHKEYKEKQRERREHVKRFGSIYKNYKWLADRLVKPTDDKHIPEGFRKAVADLLQHFDFQTERSKKLEAKYGRISQNTLRMNELRRRFAEISKEDGSGIFEYDGYIFELMEALAEKLDGKTIDQASNEELASIDMLLKAIVGNVRNYNRAFSDSIKEQISDLGNKVISSAQERIAKRGKYNDRSGAMGGIDMFLNESMVTPRDFFERIGGGMEDVFMVMRHGFDRHVDNLTKTRDFFDEIFTPYRNRTRIRKRNKPGSKIEKWRDGSQVQEIFLESGQSIKLNPAQMMTLYCLSKREQARGHIFGSGIVASRVDSASKIKQALGAKIETNGVTVQITTGDIANIIAMLKPEQIEMADRLQEYLNNECAAWGNEVSMKLYGYEKFTEKNYFPIKSADAYLDSDFEGRQATERIKNFGFTKGTVVNANNPIMIDDIFRVTADHINKMSMYNAFAAPISDFTRVYNYKVRDEDGNQTASVKSSLEDAYGKKVARYINNFMADVNSAAQTRVEGVGRFVNKSLANYKKATIGGNLRVALQQPTAVLRAMIMINPCHFVNGKINVAKNMRDMKEHCQVARWKSWGHNQVDMARDIDEIMMNNEWTHIDLVTMEIYGALDNITWSTIWAAVRSETKSKHPDIKVDSEEFYKICNERASEIFDKTQVVDSVFHRSQVMRNTDTTIKMMTSFMAEPTRTFNMVRSEMLKARDMWKDGNKGKAVIKANEVMFVFAANAAAVSAAAAIADALRGKDADDDGEEDGWWENFLANFWDNINVFKMLPVVKDIWGFAEGWDSQNMAMEGYEALVQSAMDLADPEKRNFRKFAESAGLVFGLPIKNVLRELESAFKLFGIEVSAAETGEEEETEKKKSIDTILGWFNIKDGSGFDKVLNKMGLNRTDAEKAEAEFQKTVKDVENKIDGLSGTEKEEKIWDTVTDGYTKRLEEGDMASIRQMRRVLEAVGGDTEKFDERVTEEARTALKKTIGVDAEAGNVLRDYLIENCGYTEGKISREIISNSDTAKEMQLAICENDMDAAVEHLRDLIDAGITYEDFNALYISRHKAIKGADYSTGEFINPVSGTITSTFGYRNAPTAGASSYHRAIDIGAEHGSPVAAADGGKVSSCGWDGGYGYSVTIDHGNGLYTKYNHLYGFYVQKGDSIAQGQTIGQVGSTGVSTGPHLDFQVRVNGQYVDPMIYLGKYYQ